MKVHRECQDECTIACTGGADCLIECAMLREEPEEPEEREIRNIDHILDDPRYGQAKEINNMRYKP